MAGGQFPVAAVSAGRFSDTLRMSYFPVMPRWKSTHLASHLSRIMVFGLLHSGVSEAEVTHLRSSE